MAKVSKFVVVRSLVTYMFCYTVKYVGLLAIIPPLLLTYVGALVNLGLYVIGKPLIDFTQIYADGAQDFLIVVYIVFIGAMPPLMAFAAYMDRYRYWKIPAQET